MIKDRIEFLAVKNLYKKKTSFSNWVVKIETSLDGDRAIA